MAHVRVEIKLQTLTFKLMYFVFVSNVSSQRYKKTNDALTSGTLCVCMVPIVGDTATNPRQHSRRKVLRYTWLVIAPRSLQLLQEVIGGGGRRHLVDLVLQDRPEIFCSAEVQAVPWPHSPPPEATEALLTSALRLLGCVWAELSPARRRSGWCRLSPTAEESRQPCRARGRVTPRVDTARVRLRTSHLLIRST